MGFGTPVALLVGIILILVAVGLFFLDKFKPGYKRDSDTVYAVLFLTVGIMSLVNWSQNFLESFQLLILAGMLIALVIESIQRRSINSQAKQAVPPYRDEERERPSRGYRQGFEENRRSEVRAEFDDDLISPLDDSSRVRRIRGSREGTRDAYPSDSFTQLAADDSREPRRSSSRRSSAASDEGQYGNSAYGEQPSQRSRRHSPLQLEGDGAGGTYSDKEVGAESSSSRRRRPMEGSSAEESLATPGSRSARRRPKSNGERPADGDYVDYKPLGLPRPPRSDEDDNSGNFDDNSSFR